MAISQYLRRDVSRDWQLSAVRGVSAFERLRHLPLDLQNFWSVNLPVLDLLGTADGLPIVECSMESAMLNFHFEALDPSMDAPPENGLTQAIQYRSNYQQRPRSAGRDVELCFAGNITATKLPSSYHP
jgi:broad specificity polyphosphatase/5'/3'-nucleotidase SurE